MFLKLRGVGIKKQETTALAVWRLEKQMRKRERERKIEKEQASEKNTQDE